MCVLVDIKENMVKNNFHPQQKAEWGHGITKALTYSPLDLYPSRHSFLGGHEGQKRDNMFSKGTMASEATAKQWITRVLHWGQVKREWGKEAVGLLMHGEKDRGETGPGKSRARHKFLGKREYPKGRTFYSWVTALQLVCCHQHMSLKLRTTSGTQEGKVVLPSCSPDTSMHLCIVWKECYLHDK